MEIGAGSAVKAGAKALSLASKAGKAISRTRKIPCNSFAADTPVLMADGVLAAISTTIKPGDRVWTTDPVTGQSSAQPVLDLIVGHGDKHLVTITTRDPGSGASEQITATANHPVWVQERGWVNADALTVGDRMRGATGGILVVQATHDHGWLSGQTVYNLTVATTHTYHVGATTTLVHNCSMGTLHNIPNKGGIDQSSFKTDQATMAFLEVCESGKSALRKW